MKVPDFKDPEVTQFLVDLNKEIERNNKKFLSAITANNSVLLQSPSNKVYEVKISDGGSLIITMVQG